VSYVTRYAPAIYQMISAADSYDHLLKNGVADPATVIDSGASSAEYAGNMDHLCWLSKCLIMTIPRERSVENHHDPARGDSANLDSQDEFDAWISEQLESVKAICNWRRRSAELSPPS